MQVVLASSKHLSLATNVLLEGYFANHREARKTLVQKIKNKECIVAVKNGEVAGVLNYARNYSHYANYVEDIIVAKAHRRTGVATALFEKYVAVSRKEQSRKQPYALSSTAVVNTASIALHASFGFVVLGTVKKLHYGKDEIIFGYKLR